MKRLRSLTLTLAAVLLAATSAHAADHIDSPAATAEPTADITDVFAWMTADTDHLNLILDVYPFADGEAAFSDAVQYVFHVNSSTAYGAAQTETLIICQFYDVDALECWVGDDDYLVGNPSDPAGITSTSGGIRAFAGPRDDPFFMEFTGFTATVEAVVAAAGDLDFDDEGCPDTTDVYEGLVAQLQSTADGDPATDSFAGQNVLALVLQVDKDLVTEGGPLLSVWASTHAAN